MSGWEKDPTEVVDFEFSWASWLAAGETITAATVTSDDAALTISNVDHDTTSVTFRATGGNSNTRVDVTCNITTSAGEQGEDTRSITIRDTAPAGSSSAVTYATIDDLTGWLRSLELAVPTNADGLLRSASVLVARAANRNLYTDTPTDTDALALRDATTAQVASWVALGLAPAAAGLDSAPVKRSKIGSGEIERDTTGQSDARKTAATELATEAKEILLSGGLLALNLPYWTSDTDQLADYGLPRTRIDSGRRYNPAIDWPAW